MGIISNYACKQPENKLALDIMTTWKVRPTPCPPSLIKLDPAENTYQVSITK